MMIRIFIQSRKLAAGLFFVMLVTGGMLLSSCSSVFVLLPQSRKTLVSTTGFLAPDDENITVTGAFFLQKSPERMVINRITERVLQNDSTFMSPEKARTQTGVSILLASDSPRVTFRFEPRDSSVHRFSAFAVYRDGRFVRQVVCSPLAPVTSVTETNPDTLGHRLVTWEIVLPPFFGVHFTGVEVARGSRYRKVARNGRLYVAIGNSITHGTGQRSSDQTYPFILARKKGWLLYNLAVGGSRTSWPVATLLRGKKVDVISVLWGYNDWNAGFTLEQERTFYRRLVQELLRAQPEAQIYCITPTFTYRTRPKRGNLSLDDIRDVQAEVVHQFQAKGYRNLHLIRGEAVSDGSFLKPQGSADVVHFTVAGAARFAEVLGGLMTVH